MFYNLYFAIKSFMLNKFLSSVLSHCNYFSLVENFRCGSFKTKQLCIGINQSHYISCSPPYAVQTLPLHNSLHRLIYASA